MKEETTQFTGTKTILNIVRSLRGLTEIYEDDQIVDDVVKHVAKLRADNLVYGYQIGTQAIIQIEGETYEGKKKFGPYNYFAQPGQVFTVDELKKRHPPVVPCIIERCEQAGALFAVNTSGPLQPLLPGGQVIDTDTGHLLYECLLDRKGLRCVPRAISPALA